MKNLYKIIIIMVAVLTVLGVFVACKNDPPPTPPAESSSSIEETSTSLDITEESSSEEESSTVQEESSTGFSEGINKNPILGPGWTDWYPSDYTTSK